MFPLSSRVLFVIGYGWACYFSDQRIMRIKALHDLKKSTALTKAPPALETKIKFIFQVNLYTCTTRIGNFSIIL